MNSKPEQHNASTAMGLWPDAGKKPQALRVRSRDQDRTVPLSELDAVIECPPITPVPAAPEWLLGVAAYKGAPLSVIDLAAACGECGSASPAGSKRLLLVEAGRHRVGFSVDAIVSNSAEPSPGDGSEIALRALAVRLLGVAPSTPLEPADSGS